MEAWINAFLVHLQNKNFSPHTIRSYRADLQEFLLFFKKRKQDDLRFFTSANIRSFLASLQTLHQILVSGRALQNRISIILCHFLDTFIHRLYSLRYA